jgi:hypothetical protein
MAYAVDSNHVDLALRLLTASAAQAALVVGQPPPLEAVTMTGAAQHPLYPRALATAAVYTAERGDAPAAEQLADGAIAAATGLTRPDPLVAHAVHVRGPDDSGARRRAHPTLTTISAPRMRLDPRASNTSTPLRSETRLRSWR